MKDKRLIRILALDDDALMLKLISTLLTQLGFSQIDLCQRGSAALAMLGIAEQQPQLILLDINMPDMDGVEFVRHLVEYKYRGAIILVSGEANRFLQSIQKLATAHHLNCVGVIMKPIDRLDFSEVIDRWLLPDGAGKPTKEVNSQKANPIILKAAIENGELLSYYQPKVSMSTGEIVGFESLVRWHSPLDGMHFPDQFVSVAEEFGLVQAMTRFVLGNTLQQAKQWLDAGYHWRLSVNVSMKDLSSLSFLDEIVTLTNAAGLQPQHLIIEVTESCLSADERISLEILTRLHLKRFRLSIDDFGTGNSSLTQLTETPFDELKIDQRFVHRAYGDASRCAALDASLGLARQLNMEAVAEGVEDRADWDFLLQKNCDVAQGYFISKPLAAAAIPDWVETWKYRYASLV